MNSYVKSAVNWAGVVALTFTGLPGALVHAGEFPEKPIRLIIPYPPGGSNDVLGRYIGIKLGDRLGEQIVIDNRGGANGIIGTEVASRSDPDGYTLLMISTSFVMNAAVRKLPYDVEKSFDPIATLGFSPNAIIVNPDWGVNTVKELVARAKAKPASISYGSTGVASFNHFGGELFKKVAGIDLIMVPYKGGGPAMIDVMAGQIPMMFSSITQALPLIRQGKLKVIAIGSLKRSPVLPEIPTVSESGYPDYDMSVWWGFAAPDGVPTEQMTKLHKEFTEVTNDPQTKKRLLADAAEPLSMTPPEFRKMISTEIKKWREIAKQAGLVVQ